VPVRLEIGLKEASAEQVTIFRRDNDTKELVNFVDLSARLEKLMLEIQNNLYAQAYDFSQKHIRRIENWEEIDEAGGWFEASWSEDPATEKQLKEKYGLVSRVLLVDQEQAAPKNKKCFISGQPAKHDWLFAKCY